MTRTLEEFSEDAALDCAALYNPAQASHLAGETVHIWGNGWYGGQTSVSAAGVVADNGNLLLNSQVGFHFNSKVQPWPVENIQSERAGMLKVRLIRGSVSVLDTISFQCRANRTVKTIDAYQAGDDVALPPTEKTKLYKFNVFGNRDHPELEFIKHIPGPFHVLAVTQEVQV